MWRETAGCKLVPERVCRFNSYSLDHKGLNMKNPCDTCIVSTCCSQVCDKKINYENLLRDGLKYYGNSPYRIKDINHNKIRQRLDHSQLQRLRIILKSNP